MAIKVTDEMRKAVFAELCAEEGHAVDGNTAISYDENNRRSVRSADPDKLPHLHCMRCGASWIVISEGGDDYDDAEMKLRDRVYKHDQLNARPERKRKDTPKA